MQTGTSLQDQAQWILGHTCSPCSHTVRCGIQAQLPVAGQSAGKISTMQQPTGQDVVQQPQQGIAAGPADTPCHSVWA